MLGDHQNRAGKLANRLSVSERVQGYRTGDEMKRVGDLVMASVLIALCLPLMAIVALAIKLDSPGPILARQVRLSFGGRRIQVLKFRTTVHEPHDTNTAWRRDKHMTRMGRFLRKSRIEELPQLINVLRGELSLIGPAWNRTDLLGPQ